MNTKKAKHIAVILSALAFLSVFSFGMTACGSDTAKLLENMTNEEKAQYLSAQSDKYYADGVREQISITGTISGNAAGIEMSGSTSTELTSTVLHAQTDDFSFFTSETTHSSILMDGEEQNDSYTEYNGFVGGEYLIYAYIPDPEAQNSRDPAYLKGVCTPAEAREYVALQGTTVAALADETENLFKTVTVTTDKKQKQWIINYSDFKKTESPEFEQWLKAQTGILPAELELKDMSGIFTVDMKTSALIEYEIGIKMEINSPGVMDLTLDMTVRSQLSLPTETDLMPDNFDKYRACGDLRYRYFALQAFEKLVASDSVSFNLDVSNRASHKRAVSYNSSVTGDAINYTESDVIHYGMVNDKFRYNIEATVNKNNTVSMRYDGEKQTIYTDGSMLQATSQSQEDARAFVKATLSVFFFDQRDLIKMSVTQNKDGTSKVFLHFCVTDELKSMFETAGYGTFTSEDYFVRLYVDLDENLDLTGAEFALRGEQETETPYTPYGQTTVYTVTAEAIISNISTADEGLLAAE